MMNATEMSEVLTRVKAWIPEMRILLARRILEDLELPQISEPPRKMPPEQIFGILKTASPPPNDEECAKIVGRERLRKYK